MSLLRVGTRGSELALRQTEWVCQQLREADPAVEIERVVIKTHGDIAGTQRIDESWPVGAFVSALERALIDGRIDVAVHSYKDLPTAATPGLSIAAVPVREAPHDVLLTAYELELHELPSGALIGTSSPRRAAQMKSRWDVEIVPLRGNVPTRIAELRKGRLDGVVLAAAGLRRLGVTHPYWIDLPVDSFVPAPGQGALALQVRTRAVEAARVALLDDPTTRRAVTAERAFLRETNAGCHASAGALAVAGGGVVSLRGRLFNADHTIDTAGAESGADPESVGIMLARRLLGRLG